MSRWGTAVVAGLAAAWVAAPWVSMARRGTVDQQHLGSLLDATVETEGFWSSAVPLPRSAPPQVTATAPAASPARSA